MVRRGRTALRADIKWVFSLIALFFLLPAVFFTGVQRLNSKPVATEILSSTIVSFMPESKFTEQIYKKLLDSARSDPNSPLSIPGLPLPTDLLNSDILDLAPRELLHSIADRAAEQLYEEGPSGLQAREGGPFAGPLAPAVSFFSRDTHRMMRLLALVFAIPGVLFSILAVAFSYRWGRPVTAGLLAVFASVPTLATLVPIRIAAQAGMGGSFGTASSAVAQGLARATALPLTLAGVGSFLVFVGIVGGIAARALGRSEESVLGAPPGEQEETRPPGPPRA